MQTKFEIICHIHGICETILQQWTKNSARTQKKLTWLLENRASDCRRIVPAIAEQSCQRQFSRNHNCLTVTGTIVQQLLTRFFSSCWHNCSTVARTNLQQLLARFFNSHWEDFFVFLCWQNSSTVMFTHDPKSVWNFIKIRSENPYDGIKSPDICKL